MLTVNLLNKRVYFFPFAYNLYFNKQTPKQVPIVFPWLPTAMAVNDQNRYLPLDTSDPMHTICPNKKKKYNKEVNVTKEKDKWPILITPTQNKVDFSRFLIITNSSTDTDKTPIANRNPIIIGKAIDAITTQYKDIKALRNGDLLIQVNKKEIADRLAKCKSLGPIPVEINYHQSLNSCQGRVYSYNIIELEEDDILDSLKKFSVTHVKKMYKIQGEKQIATGAAILTFDAPQPPKEIKMGWQILVVDPYFPNPMICKKCQRIGHTKNHCKEITSLCATCAETTPHGEECTRVFCVNCMTAEHPSKDRSCPVFIREKTVMIIKTMKRCTIKEAKEEYTNSGHLYAQYIPIQKPKKSIAQIIKEKIANETPKSIQNPFITTQTLSESNQNNQNNSLSTPKSATQEMTNNSQLQKNSTLSSQTSNIQLNQASSQTANIQLNQDLTESQQQNNIPNNKIQTAKIPTNENIKEISAESILESTISHDQEKDSRMDCSDEDQNYLVTHADKLLATANALSSSLQKLTRPIQNKNKPST